MPVSKRVAVEELIVPGFSLPQTFLRGERSGPVRAGWQGGCRGWKTEKLAQRSLRRAVKAEHMD